MFVDSVDIVITSGNGGAGCVSFRREKFIVQGGPDGGDGGRGGDVIFEVDNNAHTLANFRGKKHHKASNGEVGKPKKCAGKNGSHCIIKVPLGTQILNFENGEILHDFDSNFGFNGDQLRFIALKGGKGGLGNVHFKTATNQAPTYAQKGIAGQSLHIKLELKLIADVGLVGYPNVGKSTLISTLSNAKPKVANYEFTTLAPHLGVVEMSRHFDSVSRNIDFADKNLALHANNKISTQNTNHGNILNDKSELGLSEQENKTKVSMPTSHSSQILRIGEMGDNLPNLSQPNGSRGLSQSKQDSTTGLDAFVMADIPGIIDGASVGKGLGLQFLRHIERTKFLLFVLDSARGKLDGGLSISEQFENLRRELQAYSSMLATRPCGIVLSKIDTLDEASIATLQNDIKVFASTKDNAPQFILPISSITRYNLSALKAHIFNALNRITPKLKG